MLAFLKNRKSIIAMIILLFAMIIQSFIILSSLSFGDFNMQKKNAAQYINKSGVSTSCENSFSEIAFFEKEILNVRIS